MAWLNGLLMIPMLACAGWGAMALYFRLALPHVGRWLVAGLWLATWLVLVFLLWQGMPWFTLASISVLLLGLAWWWRSLKPLHDRPWADDVAHLASGEVRGNRLVMHHVRNFRWHTRHDVTPAWETRDYELDRLTSLDLFISNWGRPAISHVMLSFGFDDGQFVTFSVEVRREKGERFSEFGGFFKQYELAIIAADERDAVQLRSNVRGEQVTLYRVDISDHAMRELLLALVEEANRLEHEPRFYHTITANCSTLVFVMMRNIVDGLPLDYRLLLTGLLPGYVHARGGLVEGHELAELRRLGRINERAKQAHGDPAFSRHIREGIPGWETT